MSNGSKARQLLDMIWREKKLLKRELRGDKTWIKIKNNLNNKKSSPNWCKRVPLYKTGFFYNNKKSSPNWCKRVPSYKTGFFYNKVPLLMHDCPLTNAEASLNVIRAFHNSLVYICLPAFYLWRNCFQLCTSPSPDQYGDTASCFNLIAFSVDF